MLLACCKHGLFACISPGLKRSGLPCPHNMASVRTCSWRAKGDSRLSRASDSRLRSVASSAIVALVSPGPGSHKRNALLPRNATCQ